MPRSKDKESFCAIVMNKLVRLASLFAITEIGLQFLAPVNAAASKGGFPDKGTFKEQSDFIENLPKGCSPSEMQALKELSESVNPFDYKPMDHHRVELIQHQYYPENGVLVQRVRNDKALENAPKDQIEVMIGGANDAGEPVLHRFKMGANGNLQPMGREKLPVQKYAEGIERADKEGLVMIVEEGGIHHCMQAVVRNKQNN